MPLNVSIIIYHWIHFPFPKDWDPFVDPIEQYSKTWNYQFENISLLSENLVSYFSVPHVVFSKRAVIISVLRFNQKHD